MMHFFRILTIYVFYPSIPTDPTTGLLNDSFKLKFHCLNSEDNKHYLPLPHANGGRNASHVHRRLVLESLVQVVEGLLCDRAAEKHLRVNAKRSVDISYPVFPKVFFISLWG